MKLTLIGACPCGSVSVDVGDSIDSGKVVTCPEGHRIVFDFRFPPTIANIPAMMDEYLNGIDRLLAAAGGVLTAYNEGQPLDNAAARLDRAIENFRNPFGRR